MMVIILCEMKRLILLDTFGSWQPSYPSILFRLLKPEALIKTET